MKTFTTINLFWEPIKNLERFKLPDNVDANGYNLPMLAFKNKFGEITILGNDICGMRTTGCTCCSVNWDDRTISDYGYTEFAVLDICD